MLSFGYLLTCPEENPWWCADEKERLKQQEERQQQLPSYVTALRQERREKGLSERDPMMLVKALLGTAEPSSYSISFQSHYFAAKPLCRFFLSENGCRYGNRCNMRHEQPQQQPTQEQLQQLQHDRFIEQKLKEKEEKKERRRRKEERRRNRKEKERKREKREKRRHSKKARKSKRNSYSSNSNSHSSSSSAEDVWQEKR